ncbi:hypothetical protein KOR42_35730 [Thalassoglobus neptunius]|uniref:Uncharacterized protein n=1 Tax=Thalassoglobus neptunius TaxID=1938619 RepID=A0A5C5WMW9_9PLAN|nr:hypothetical protein KOR42_35730 [Thalassoglobus neptunius]
MNTAPPVVIWAAPNSPTFDSPVKAKKGELSESFPSLGFVNRTGGEDASTNRLPF